MIIDWKDILKISLVVAVFVLIIVVSGEAISKLLL
jgi:hypothetical protein